MFTFSGTCPGCWHKYCGGHVTLRESSPFLTSSFSFISQHPRRVSCVRIFTPASLPRGVSEDLSCARHFILYNSRRVTIPLSRNFVHSTVQVRGSFSSLNARLLKNTLFCVCSFEHPPLCPSVLCSLLWKLLRRWNMY